MDVEPQLKRRRKASVVTSIAKICSDEEVDSEEKLLSNVDEDNQVVDDATNVLKSHSIYHNDCIETPQESETTKVDQTKDDSQSKENNAKEKEIATEEPENLELRNELRVFNIAEDCRVDAFDQLVESVKDIDLSCLSKASIQCTRSDSVNKINKPDQTRKLHADCDSMTTRSVYDFLDDSPTRVNVRSRKRTPKPRIDEQVGVQKKLTSYLKQECRRKMQKWKMEAIDEKHRFKSEKQQPGKRKHAASAAKIAKSNATAILLREIASESANKSSKEKQTAPRKRKSPTTQIRGSADETRNAKSALAVDMKTKESGIKHLDNTECSPEMSDNDLEYVIPQTSFLRTRSVDQNKAAENVEKVIEETKVRTVKELVKSPLKHKTPVPKASENSLGLNSAVKQVPVASRDLQTGKKKPSTGSVLDQGLKPSSNQIEFPTVQVSNRTLPAETPAKKLIRFDLEQSAVTCKDLGNSEKAKSADQSSSLSQMPVGTQLTKKTDCFRKPMKKFFKSDNLEYEMTAEAPQETLTATITPNFSKKLPVYQSSKKRVTFERPLNTFFKSNDSLQTAETSQDSPSNKGKQKRNLFSDVQSTNSGMGTLCDQETFNLKDMEKETGNQNDQNKSINELNETTIKIYESTLLQNNTPDPSFRKAVYGENCNDNSCDTNQWQVCEVSVEKSILSQKIPIRNDERETNTNEHDTTEYNNLMESEVNDSDEEAQNAYDEIMHLLKNCDCQRSCNKTEALLIDLEKSIGILFESDSETDDNSDGEITRTNKDVSLQCDFSTITDDVSDFEIDISISSTQDTLNFGRNTFDVQNILHSKEIPLKSNDKTQMFPVNAKQGTYNRDMKQVHSSHSDTNANITSFENIDNDFSKQKNNPAHLTKQTVVDLSSNESDFESDKEEDNSSWIKNRKYESNYSDIYCQSSRKDFINSQEHAFFTPSKNEHSSFIPKQHNENNNHLKTARRKVFTETPHNSKSQMDAISLNFNERKKTFRSSEQLSSFDKGKFQNNRKLGQNQDPQTLDLALQREMEPFSFDENKQKSKEFGKRKHGFLSATQRKVRKLLESVNNSSCRSSLDSDFERYSPQSMSSILSEDDRNLADLDSNESDCDSSLNLNSTKYFDFGKKYENVPKNRFLKTLLDSHVDQTPNKFEVGKNLNPRCRRLFSDVILDEELSLGSQSDSATYAESDYLHPRKDACLKHRVPYRDLYSNLSSDEENMKVEGDCRNRYTKKFLYENNTSGDTLFSGYQRENEQQRKEVFYNPMADDYNYKNLELNRRKPSTNFDNSMLRNRPHNVVDVNLFSHQFSRDQQEDKQITERINKYMKNAIDIIREEVFEKEENFESQALVELGNQLLTINNLQQESIDTGIAFQNLMKNGQILMKRIGNDQKKHIRIIKRFSPALMDYNFNDLKKWKDEKKRIMKNVQVSLEEMNEKFLQEMEMSETANLRKMLQQMKNKNRR